MNYQTILYRVEDYVAIITLNRPERLNSLSSQLLGELHDALKRSEADSQVRCIVVTGAGRGFCAGADLQELEETYKAGKAPSLGENLRKLFNPVIRSLREIEKPIIGLINGPAAGAGLGIALACDVRIASEKATFVEAFAKVGLVPDSGTSFFLPRMIGLAKTHELMFTGDGIDAKEAESLGVVNSVVPAEELEKVGLEFARKLARGPTKSFGLAKRLLNRSLTSTLSEALEHEAYDQEITGKTSDHIEGVKAFLEKRSPVFRGK